MCKDKKQFNGWTNYETWLVALWLSNEQTTSDYWAEEARRCKVDTKKSNNVRAKREFQEVAAPNLAKQIKEDISHESPLDEASLYCDLLESAIQSVNWIEIARSFIEDD